MIGAQNLTFSDEIEVKLIMSQTDQQQAIVAKRYHAGVDDTFTMVTKDLSGLDENTTRIDLLTCLSVNADNCLSFGLVSTEEYIVIQGFLFDPEWGRR